MKMDKFLKRLVLILFLLMIIIIFVSKAKAESKNNWSVSASIYKTMPANHDPDRVAQSGTGLQASFLYKDVFGLYISKDTTPLRFAGQSGVDLDLKSIGIVFQRKLSEHLTIGLDVGWYEPDFNGMDEPQPYPHSPFAEGLCRQLNKYLWPDQDYPAWDYYTLNYHGSIGGKLKLDLKYPITEWLSFDATVGYRYLSLLENIQGRNWSNGNDWAATNYWTVRYDRDFSSYLIGFNFTVKF